MHETEQSVGAWLRIAPDHPALAGHFPGDPIVPGAVLLDETLHSIDPQTAHWRIGSVKFHRIVRPGETLQLDWRRDGGRCGSKCAPPMRWS